MTSPQKHRILVVDDEEAILETMTFTFEDDYDVLTASSARAGLETLDAAGPVAVVISDQRMPETTGVEFLAQVFERHPSTVRIILTGFADMDATIGAINDGHVYAYVTKPWEPDELKRVVRRAVEHHELASENERLVSELKDANVFLQGVVDELDTGALAVDAAGVVQAANRGAREYLGLDSDPRGTELIKVLGGSGSEEVRDAVQRLGEAESGAIEEVACEGCGSRLRLRVHLRALEGADGGSLGSVVLLREISHEPLRRRFEELLEAVAKEPGPVREPLEAAQADLRTIASEAQASNVVSPGMSELSERASRTVTAIDNWLAVEDSLRREDYPDAQLLRDRMRMANSRWPLADRIPSRVQELARRVEAYYESGENEKQPIL
ncbi:MAG: response regulator [Myxococcales bacterium]|nr:response regulator [Myxococcales bacterium]